MVPRFEVSVAQYCGVQHSVAVNSGTSALHIACLALDLGPGDWLWTSPNTFVASANAALYCGAKVDFVDINPRTYNISETSEGKAYSGGESRSPAKNCYAGAFRWPALRYASNPRAEPTIWL